MKKPYKRGCYAFLSLDKPYKINIHGEKKRMIKLLPNSCIQVLEKYTLGCHTIRSEG